MINPITGEFMEDRGERILCYGIDAINMRLLRFLFSSDYNVCDVSDCFTDILAVNAVAVFINPDELSEEMLESLNEAFEDDNHTMLIFTRKLTQEVKFHYHVIYLDVDSDLKLRLIQKHLHHRKIISEEWNWKECSELLDKVIIIDEETNGWDVNTDDFIYLNAVYLEKNVVKDRVEVLIKQEKPISQEVEEITHITNEQLANAKDLKTALLEIYNMCPEAQWLVYDEGFVYPFYARARKKAALDINFGISDLRTMFMNVYPNVLLRRLGDLCKEVGATEEDSDLEVLVKGFGMVYANSRQ